MSIDRHDVGARMSQIVIHNGVVYLSGQTSDAGKGGEAKRERKSAFIELRTSIPASSDDVIDTPAGATIVRSVEMSVQSSSVA